MSDFVGFIRTDQERAEAFRKVKDFSKKPADIAFVLDESGSIWGPDFTKEIAFVKDLVQCFDVSEGMTHVGVMTFDTFPTVHFHLDDVHGEANMLSSLNKIIQGGGGTVTFDAIRMMQTQMFSEVHSRSNVPRIAIVITDGGSANSEKTKRESAAAHKQGITMFAIGVGQHINEKELYKVASSPEYVFKVDNYDTLTTLKEDLIEATCKVTEEFMYPPPQGAGTTGPTLDIQFAMSDRAGVEGTDLSLRYIDSITERLSLISDKTLVSVTPKAGDASAPAVQPISLKDSDSQVSFSRNTGRNMKGANTAEHLRYMHAEGIAPSDMARASENVTHFGILIVDNKAAHKAELLKQAKNAVDKKIHVIVLGVGPYVEEEELKGVANTDDDWFRVNGYATLQTLVDPVMDRILRNFHRNESAKYYPIDVQFAMPDRAGVEGTDLSLRYIDSITQRLSLISDQVLVSVTPKAGDASAPAVQPISLTESDSQVSFSQNTGRNMKGANTPEHLRYMHAEGISPAYRAQLPDSRVHFGIIIVDNKAADKAELLKQAKNARDKNIHVIVLGVGPYVEEEELKGVANTDDDWFHVNSYADLQSLVDPVMDRIEGLSRRTASPEPVAPLLIDVQFALPDQAGVEGTDLSLRYIDSIVKSLSLVPGQTLVSVTPKAADDSAPAIQPICLKDNDSQISFSHSARRKVTGTNTAGHLRYMHSERISPSSKAQVTKDTVCFGILIVDNKAADKAVLENEAKNARDKKIHVIVLGVGPYVEEEELKGVANTDDDWFHVKGYADLQTLVDPIMDRIHNVSNITRPA